MKGGAVLNPAYYLPIIMMLLIVYFTTRNEKALLKKIINNKNKNPKENSEMIELCKKFIGKECIIYTYNSQIEATVKEVTDGALLIERNGEEEVINIDYVIRVREYPRNKKGKKKSIVVD